MPFSSKRASERQSETSSRSPCTTWKLIALCPSLKVVNSCPRAAGMVVLRGMIFSTRPPIVSMPSESGITSSSSQSSPCGRLPASTFACIAAPSATTLSGSRLLSGSRRKNSPTARWICGMRVAPPTITTPLISSTVRPASRSALRTGPSVLCTSVWVMRQKVSVSSVTSTSSPEESFAVMLASE